MTPLEQNLSTFLRAHDFVQRWEGGSAFTVDPNDPGGATKYGVSFRFLQNLPLKDADVNRDRVVCWRDVQALTHEQATSIFLRYFWLVLRCDELPERLALAIYDTAVNCGRTRAAGWLQREVGAKVDGIIGPKTVEAVRRQLILGRDLLEELIICRNVLARRECHYIALADEHDWARKYRRGWMNRTRDLMQVITGEA